MTASLDNNTQFTTCAIIELADLCTTEVRAWLQTKLNATNLLTKLTCNFEDKLVFLHLGISDEHLLKGAELLGLQKSGRNNEMKKFLVGDRADFEGSEDLDRFMSQADRLKVIEWEISGLRLDREEVRFENGMCLYGSEGVVNQLIRQRMVHAVFPIHDKERLKFLETIWYKNAESMKLLHFIPIDEIRNYFGESVAFYFSFFEYYTKWLIPLAVIGLLTWFMPAAALIKFATFSVCNLVWSTLFIEKWKRKSALQSFNWGVYDAEVNEKARVEFEGEPRISPITDKLEMHYSKKSRMMKKYFVSYPIVFISILLTVLTMLAYYKVENKTLRTFTGDSYLQVSLTFLPSIAYSIVVMVYGMVYSQIAVALTNWENHRTETSYESNLTVKLFVFYFANNFVCLFYEAFYNRNFNNLSSMMISLFTMNAIINKLLEVFAPYLKKRIKKQIFSKKIQSKDKITNEVGKQAYTLDYDEGTYNDYITLFEQFAYVTLFSSVFPWLSLLALLNNLMEERSDAFKYCHVTKRPFPKPCKDIGAWLPAFEIIGFVSVATNFGLIALHPEARLYFQTLSDCEYVMLFVGVEHLLVLIKVVIMNMVPDVPGRVLQQRLKRKLEACEALKKDRLARLSKKEI